LPRCGRRIELIDLKIQRSATEWQHLTIAPDLLDAASSRPDRLRWLFDPGLEFDPRILLCRLPDPAAAWIDPSAHRHPQPDLLHPGTRRTAALWALPPFESPQALAAWMQPAWLIRPSSARSEFFLFDDVLRLFQAPVAASTAYQSESGWNSGPTRGRRQPGQQNPQQGGYFRSPPKRHLPGHRSEMLLTMAQLGLPIEKHHHEVGAPAAGTGFSAIAS